MTYRRHLRLTVYDPPRLIEQRRIAWTPVVIAAIPSVLAWLLLAWVVLR